MMDIELTKEEIECPECFYYFDANIKAINTDQDVLCPYCGVNITVRYGIDLDGNLGHPIEVNINKDKK